MGGGGRLCWSLMLPGLAQYPLCPPHPHLPLPAHCGEDRVQHCGKRVSLRGHALGAGGGPWSFHEGEPAQTA